jgi:NAD(P)-dependent dehydrogenase (short-subunit alcohol dehydrogenase family)
MAIHDTTKTLPLGGRHALVTGASRGIGAAIALELAHLGADLTVVARDGRGLDAVATRFAQAGARHVVTVEGDMSDPNHVTASVAKAEQALGPIAILINNAGGAESAPFTRTDAALWRRMFALNVDSVHAACRAALPGMIGAGWGRIVNIASTAGLKGYAYVSAYVAAKHAVVGLTRALALETARQGVTVNAVCPGYTDTPMLEGAIRNIAEKTRISPDDARANLAASNPMQRLIKPEEIAACVGWLCRRESDVITGAAIPISAGEI